MRQAVILRLIFRFGSALNILSGYGSDSIAEVAVDRTRYDGTVIPRVSPCEPVCTILLVKASVYPLSPVKTNVSRLCECDLKPRWRGLSHAVWDVTSADWAVIGGTYL